MRTLRAKVRWLSVALAVVLASAGCGGKKEDEGGDKPAAARPTGEVSGTVTLEDGKPLPVGWIAFHGKDASETALATVTDGKYVAKGVPVGDDIRVTVDAGAAAKEATDLDDQIWEAQTRAGLLAQAGKLDPALGKRIGALKERRAQLDKAVKAVKGLRVAPPGMFVDFSGFPYPKFLLAETTPLKLKVATGSQTFNVELKP
jgi:hypothetical protein